MTTNKNRTNLDYKFRLVLFNYPYFLHQKKLSKLIDSFYRVNLIILLRR